MGDPLNDRKSFTVTTYLADKERNIRLIRWLLKSICIWPQSSNASIVGRIVLEFSLLTCFSALFTTTMGIAAVIFIEQRANTDLVMMQIGPFICYVLTDLKYICLVLHVKDIRKCVDCIELDWDTVRSAEDHKVMLRHAKTGRFMAIFLTVFIHCATQFYNLTMCFMTSEEEVDNVSVSIHKLPYPFFTENVNDRFSPVYEMGLVVHSLSAFLVASVSSISCGLMAIFVMHACGQLEIITLWLGDIVHDNDVVDVNTVQRKLGFIVEHHLRVINFVSYIEEVIYMTCLVELVGGSLTLCLLGYCSITAWNQDKRESIPTYCVAAFSFTVNIFIICYIAELLSEQYRRVGMAAYMTEWYRLPPKTALGLLLISLRSNFNINLTAGKMIDLSLYTFGNVLKTAVAYLNMLRQVAV